MRWSAFPQRSYRGGFLTIVTYGRTGSTALQATLNALPGVLVRGENYSAMRGLEGYVQALAETSDRHRGRRPDHPWFGAAELQPSAALADLREHVIRQVLRPQPQTRWLGFKEVRYEPGHFEDHDLLLAHLIFLGRLFPGLRYLVNVRDPRAVSRSGWWPAHGDALEVLDRTRTRLRVATQDLNAFWGGERAVCLEYEEWNADPGVLIDAFARLGLPQDDAAVLSTLSRHLSHGPSGQSGVGTQDPDDGGAR